MTMTVLVLLFCAVVVGEVQSAEVKRHVAEDPLISKFAGQEILLKTIEKIVVEKFAKLAGDMAGLRQEVMTTKMEIANLKENVTMRMNDFDVKLKELMNEAASIDIRVSESHANISGFCDARLEQEMKSVTLEMSTDHKALTDKISNTDKKVETLQNVITKQLADTSAEIKQSIANRCPSGYNGNEYGCYKPVSEGVSWDTAKQRCMSDGGHLVVIDTAEELQAVGVLMGRMGVTTGVYSIDGRRVNGQWRWTSVNKPFAYTNWYSSEPNDSGECVRMDYRPTASYNLEWSDGPCTSTYYYLCEA